MNQHSAYFWIKMNRMRAPKLYAWLSYSPLIYWCIYAEFSDFESDLAFLRYFEVFNENQTLASQE